MLSGPSSCFQEALLAGPYSSARGTGRHYQAPMKATPGEPERVFEEPGGGW